MCVLIDDLQRYRAKVLDGKAGGKKGSGGGERASEEVMKIAWKFDPRMFYALVLDYREAKRVQEEAAGKWKCQKWVDSYINVTDEPRAYQLGIDLQDVFKGETGNGVIVDGLKLGGQRKRTGAKVLKE